jgi:p-aminobenzoyl-glutamate transporter AbgT
MFSKNKTSEPTYDEQRDLFLHAQNRIKEKKKLYYHFIVFVVGGIFLFTFNKIFNYYPEYNWYLWLITIWLFFLIVHFINVFVTHKFLGPEWEKVQLDNLVAKQLKRIEELNQKLATESSEVSGKTKTADNE